MTIASGSALGHTTVALKVLRAAVASDLERLARFQHEAKPVAGGGVRFLTMALVDAGLVRPLER